jgi:hypothetical protein
MEEETIRQLIKELKEMAPSTHCDMLLEEAAAALEYLLSEIDRLERLER